MQEKNIINVLQDEFIPYAGEILVNNLPSLDGLLPVNRKVIYSLYKNGITHNKSFIKMLRASSMAMVYYVFGDMPLTNAMKNMGNNSLNYLYLQPKGSFGDKQRKEGVGASPRYIECKLSSYSESMLLGINKNNVPMKRNFDNTENEPTILPSIVPNILINTSQSIAVGEASKIPSHNLNEVCDSFISYIKHEDIEKSIQLLNGADFSLKGRIIYDKNTFEKIYKTGKGSFTLIGNYIYDDKENKISIIEVPYETYIEDIETKLRNCYDKGLFKEIIDIHDGTDKDGIRLDIYLKKNTNIKQFEQKLRKYTPYESKFSCNFTILDLDGKTPKLMPLEDIIKKWTQHRINCIKNEIQYDISKNEIELNKLYGLKIINQDLDTAIKLIRSSKTEKIAIEKLISHFELNQEQAEYISTIRLVNINQEWIFKKIQNINEVEQENTKLNKYYNSELSIKDTIISQLEEVKKKYGRPRATQLIYNDTIEEYNPEQLIENYNTKIYITKDNYFKKIPCTSLRGFTTNKLKDNDIIISESDSTNKSTLLLFSNKGICYKLYEWQLEDYKLSQYGLYLRNELSLDKDEYITHIVSTEDYKGYLLMCFQNGKIAKINLSSYKTKTQRSKLQNAYNINSKIINIIQIQNNIDILCKSSINKVLIINTSCINSKTSKNTQGVQILKSKNDSIMDLCVPLNYIDIDKINDVEYYRSIRSGIGNYLKRDDKIITTNFI